MLGHLCLLLDLTQALQPALCFRLIISASGVVPEEQPMVTKLLITSAFHLVFTLALN